MLHLLDFPLMHRLQVEKQFHSVSIQKMSAEHRSVFKFHTLRPYPDLEKML